MAESGDNPTPNFDPRPPGQRRRVGDDSDGSTKRGGRRTRNGLKIAHGDHGFMGRLTGRAEMDRQKIKRYDPYRYESNTTQLRWTVLALTAWVVVALLVAWQDREAASVLVDIKDRGFVSAPPSFVSPSAMIEFAEREGLNCTNAEGNFLNTLECTRLWDVQADYEDRKARGSYSTVVLLILLLANMFAFGSFTHRASRNLLTMKSKGQHYTPEKAVFWFFIPVLNMIKPWQVFRELFRGSDPDVSVNDETAWKTKGKVPAVVHVWAVIFVAVFIFNPRTIGWFWYSLRETIDDVIVAHQRLVIADIMLAILGIAAIFVAVELTKQQEARHAKVAKITVMPPLPVDPLEVALKEGIRRKELENKRARSRKGRGEGK